MKTIEDYTNLCTEEQTKRAVKLGAPIPPYEEGLIMINDVWYTNTKRLLARDDDKLYIIPTTQQILGLLREKGHRFYVVCDVDNLHNYKIDVMNDKFDNLYRATGKSYEQAELAVIDAALDYLEKEVTK